MSTKTKLPRGWHRKGKGRTSVLFSERPAKVAAARAKYLEALALRQVAAEEAFLDQMEGRMEHGELLDRGAIGSFLGFVNQYGE